MSSIFYFLDILNYYVIFYIRTDALFLQFRPSAHLKHRRQKLYNGITRLKTFSKADSQPA